MSCLRNALWSLLVLPVLPSAVWADVSGTATLPQLTSLDLDTGQVLSPSALVELLWHGTLDVEPLASGYLVAGVMGAQAFAAISQSTLAGYTYSQSLILNSSRLSAGTILAVKTKQGNYSKVMVTALTPSDGSGSISLQFTTFGGGAGAGQPTVAAIENNYSFLPQWMPNWGIAPGSLFVIFGSGMANTTSPTQSSAPPGLPTTLNGVGVQVKVANTTAQCYLYYISPTQIDAVLPSTVPAGSGILIVTNNGAASAGTAINVLSSAFGILNYNGTLAAAFDGNSALLTPSNAANPNQSIVLWGTGIGADVSNDDHTYPQQQNNIAGSYLQVLVGDVPATIVYAGRSQYPGVDQIVVTVPPDAPAGCFTSVVVVAGGNTPSNVTTIPIAASGKTCSDAASPFTAQQYQAMGTQGAANIGMLIVAEDFGSVPGPMPFPAPMEFQGPIAYGSFQRVGNYGSTVGNGAVSAGSCMVTNSLSNGSPAESALDAGTSLMLKGPTGMSFSMTQIELADQGHGTYVALPVYGAFPTTSGQAFTIGDGNGGRDVGSFNATLNFPGSFTWTNQSQTTAVNNAAGLKVTWSGGAGGGFVAINGSVGASLAGTSDATVSFTCFAPLAAGTFTVSPAVLLAMPEGLGTLSVGVLSTPQFFTASGLDYGVMQTKIQTTENAMYVVQH